MTRSPNPPKILKTEAHLHLYGCLKATDLWDIGRDRYRSLESRMEWFAKEYETVFLHQPQWRKWWESPSGFDDFKKIFEFTAPGPFPTFQAKFNLLIALNPPKPGAWDLVDAVLKNDGHAGGCKEYRTFLPMYLPDAEREDYVLGLLKKFKDHQSRSYNPLVAFSLLRSPEICDESYLWLKAFSEAHPWTADFITGIDFCGSETGHPPALKKSFIRRLNDDNLLRPRPWNVLYHVGEMWDEISLASAARWVVQASEYGARRIGHGMALAVEPGILVGTTTREPLQEFHDHLEWLTLHESALGDFGYSPADRLWWERAGTKSTSGSQIAWNWTDEHCEHVRHLQRALMLMLKARNALVEVCVTSNMRIGSLRTTTDHPLRRFVDAGLEVCVATDDPGIFAIDLGYEEHVLKTQFGCSDLLLRQFEQTASKWLGV